MNTRVYVTTLILLFFANHRISHAQIEGTTESAFVPNKYGIMKVINKDVSLHEKPDKGSRSLVNIPFNTIVHFVKEFNSWRKIKMYNGGPTGWIESKSVEYCPENDTDGAIIPPSVSIIDPTNDTVDVNFFQSSRLNDLQYFKYKSKYFQLARESIKAVDEPKGFIINRQYAVEIPGTSKIYINAGDIKVVSTKDFKVTKTVDFEGDFFSISGSSNSHPSSPEHMAVSSNNLLFLTSRDYHKSNLYILDPKTDRLINYLPAMPAMGGITTSTNSKVFVTCPWDNQIIVIDAIRQQIINKIDISERPQKILYLNGKLYLTTSNGEVVILDATTDKIIKEVSVGPAPTEIWLGDDGKIYILNTASYYWD